MALRIGQFVTVCHVPPPLRQKAEVVDQLARGRFRHDLAGYIGPSFSRLPAVVRIRRLSLRVIVPASDLNEDAVSRAWAQAFTRAMFTALTYPEGEGPFEVFRAETFAVFVAGAIRSLLDGGAARDWQYAEFDEFFRLGSVAGAVGLVCEWPWESTPILLELQKMGVLERLLPRLDDLALERIFVAAGGPGDTDAAATGLSLLFAVARLAHRFPPDKAQALSSRRYALALFAAARSAGELVPTPRAVFHSLLALVWLASRGRHLDALADDEDETAGTLPAGASALVERARQMARSLPREPRMPELNAVLARLRAEFSIQPVAATARLISTELCGLFYLCSTVDRLGWLARWKQLPEFETGGVSPLLVGVALAIAGKWEPEPRVLDPGLALFAGYRDDPDLAHIRDVFAHMDDGVWQRLLDACGVEPVGAVGSAETAFDRLADIVVGRFADRIRGFRQAGRAMIVRNFIATPGKVRIEEHRIVVVPDPNPFHIAIHIAGLDSPAEGLQWPGARRLEFDIRDL